LQATGQNGQLLLMVELSERRRNIAWIGRPLAASGAAARNVVIPAGDAVNS
jgi:hypothetical protein